MSKKKTSRIAPTSNRGGLLATVIWASAALFYLYEYLVRVAPSIMEAELETAFNVNSGQLSTSLATYYFIYAPMQLIVGILFDRFGGKRLLIPATLIVAIGCIIPTLSTNSLWTLSSGRFLMGLGSAFGFVGVLYMATIWFQPNRLAFLSGMTTALGMLGAIMGETVLSGVVDSVGWQANWQISAVAGVVLAGILFVAIPKTPPWELERRKRFKEKEEKSHNFLIGLITVLKNPQTWIIGFVGGSLFLPLSLFADLWGVQYIMHVSEVSKTKAAGAISMLYLGWLFGSPISGWLSDYIGRRKAPMFWGALSSAILFWVMFMLPEINFYVLCTLLFVSGLLCSAEVVCFIAGFEANHKYLKGTAMATVNMVVMILGGLCQPIVGYILESLGRCRMLEEYADSITNTAGDYRTAMMILPAVMFLGAIVCLFMKETYIKDNSFD